MPTFLVFGATGDTGRHFVTLALEYGHKVRATVRSPEKMLFVQHQNLEIYQGSITDDPPANLDDCVHGSDYVLSVLSDAAMQRSTPRSSRGSLCRRCGVMVSNAFSTRRAPCAARTRSLSHAFSGCRNTMGRPYAGMLCPSNHVPFVC